MHTAYSHANGRLGTGIYPERHGSVFTARRILKTATELTDSVETPVEIRRSFKLSIS